MSFLFRTPLIVRRKQAYIDWANQLGGPSIPAEIADTPTIYLATDSVAPRALDEVVAESWEAIFETELEGWSDDEGQWPAQRTREIFDEWFAVELADAVIDLAPDDPLTNEDMDVEDLGYALHTCAWCDAELDEDAGRLVGFKVKDPGRFSSRQGRTVPIPLGDERVALGVVPPPDSEPARAGDDIVFKTCSRDCEQALKSHVPRALRRLFRST